MPPSDRPAAPADAFARSGGRHAGTGHGSGPPGSAANAALCVLDPANDRWQALDPRTPLLRANEPAAASGEGLFETVLARRGVPVKLPAHLQRMAAAAAACALPMPDPALWTRAATAAAQALSTAEEAMLRLVLPRPHPDGGGARAWVYAEDIGSRHVRARREGIDVLLLAQPWAAASMASPGQAPWRLQAVKSLSYAAHLAALRHVRAQGADDAILIDADGQVLEGATSNVVIARCGNGERRLLTPQAPGAILPGTTQAALFALAAAADWAVEERPLRVADLHAADGIWLVSSLRLAAPVNRIDGQALTRAPALNAELQALLAAMS